MKKFKITWSLSLVRIVVLSVLSLAGFVCGVLCCIAASQAASISAIAAAIFNFIFATLILLWDLGEILPNKQDKNN